METVVDIVRVLHSLSRYIAIVAVAAALVYFIVGLVQRRGWDALATRLGAAFRHSLSLQWVLGLLLLVVYGLWAGAVPGYQWGHAITGTVALAVAHGAWAALLKRAPDDRQKYVRALGVVVLTLVLVIGGIYALPEYLRWNFPASSI